MSVIRFENIDEPAGAATFIPNGYAGLQWSNFLAYDTTTLPGGWTVGTHSGTSVGFNGGGTNANFSSEGTFTLKSGYFTAANIPSVEVRMTAFLDGVKVGSKRFDVTNVEATFVNFNHKFAHIDQVVISTHNVIQSQVAMDDLRIDFDASRTADGHHDHAAVVAHPHFMEMLAQHTFAPHHADYDWMLC